MTKNSETTDSGEAFKKLVKIEEARRKKTRGSVNNKNRLAAFANSKREGKASWGVCHSELLQEVIVGITKLGGACTFGLSRDMGAHFLTLLLDDSKETLWFNGAADLDEALGAVNETLGGLPE